MTIYLVEHSDSEFSGFMGGVDFWRGHGSTSSKADALRLQGLGHKVSGPGIGTSTAAAGVGVPAPAVVTLSPENAALKAEEDNPDSEWSKRRAKQATKKAGRRRK